MNDQPNDSPYSDDSMDTKLLQLERELFSLTPVEVPRCLARRLDHHLTAPTQVGRSVVPAARIAPPSNVVVFQWRRIVVPAAAAVVVVSVLNRLDGVPTSVAQAADAPAGVRTPAPGQPAAVAAPQSQVQNSGYVLRSEPVYFSPGVWDSVRHQYWVQPGNSAPAQTTTTNIPRRQSLVPVSFH